jgi:uncharacterized protein involved in response to NO
VAWFTASSTLDALPFEWRMAYERDRKGGALAGNDPAPERRAGRMLGAFILTGLLFLALPGTVLGVWNLVTISSRRVPTAASTAWIQAHGQAQLFGWVGTFILGISLYVLPKFMGRFQTHFARAWTVWALWTAGVAWRWWAGVSGRGWRVGLVASAALELAAYLLTQQILWFPWRSESKDAPRRMPADLGSWLAMAGFLALGVALVLNLVISIDVARAGTGPAYPAELDHVFLLLALWGFAAPVAWGYGTRFVTIFLSLERPAQHARFWLFGGVLALVVLALARRFLAADVLALALTLAAAWALRIFRASARPPKRIGVYRHFDWFIRVSYVWLIVGAALGVLADLVPSLPGLAGASRHAVTVGFIATLIFAIGPRILPAFLNGRELWSARLMAANLWLITLGCLLRVVTESLAYSSKGLAWRLLPVSAFIELAAVLLFVLNVAMTQAQPMPAWFGPGGVSGNLPLYFYVTSFPRTRRLLVAAGLKTLGRVRRVPRTLTLAEAAAADRADLNQLLDTLRAFFAERQPRRRGRERGAAEIS